MTSEELHNRIRTEFINETISKLKNVGFESANEENLFTNEIFGIYFQALLNSKKGNTNFTDEIIDSILAEIKQKII